jgi:hypothetical protein
VGKPRLTKIEFYGEDCPLLYPNIPKGTTRQRRSRRFRRSRRRWASVVVPIVTWAAMYFEPLGRQHAAMPGGEGKT